MSYYEQPDLSKIMPDLKALSDDALSILADDILTLDRLSDYPSNYLGAEIYLREKAKSGNPKHVSDFEQYRNLKEKYPWYTHRESPEIIRSNARMMDAWSAMFGSGSTANPQAEEDYLVRQASKRKYSSDLIHEERMRRRAKPDNLEGKKPVEI